MMYSKKEEKPMPKRVIQLSDAKVRTAKPRKSAYKLFDGGGLYLFVTPAGGKLWCLKYRADGKNKKLSFGPYPEVSLADARTEKDKARKEIERGIDPGAVRKVMKQVETFQGVALEWHTKFSPMWTPEHAEIVMGRLKRDLFPLIGARPIKGIKAPELLAVLRRIESRGALASAHRARTIAGQVLRYAVATGKAERDCSGDLKGALPQPAEKHYAAITDPKQVGPLLRAIHGYQCSFVVKHALHLPPCF
jgi:hypothetical protein